MQDAAYRVPVSGPTPRLQMRALLVTSLALVCLAVVLSAGDSRAGEPAREESGEFLALDADVSPPQPSTGRRPRGISLEVHTLSGNLLTGAPASEREISRSLELRLPRGMGVNHTAFPICREAALIQRGPPACPRRSLIARGKSLIDIRPAIPDFLALGQAMGFNGRDASGERAILLWGKTNLGVSGVLPFKIKRPGRTGGWRFVIEGGPTPPPPGTLTLAVVGADLTFPDRTGRVGRKRVHFLEAPRRCRRSWTFQFIATRYSGRRMIASDRVPCAS